MKITINGFTSNTCTVLRHYIILSHSLYLPSYCWQVFLQILCFFKTSVSALVSTAVNVKVSLYITTFKTLPVNWDHIDPCSLQSYLLIFVAAISNSVHLSQLYPIINEREQCDITAYKVCKFCASFIDIMNKILMLQCVCKKDLIFSNINWL